MNITFQGTVWKLNQHSLVQSQQWKQQPMIEIWCKSLFKVNNGNTKQWLKYNANPCSKSTRKQQAMIEIWCKSLFKVNNGNSRQWLKYDANPCSKSTMETPDNDWNMMQILVQSHQWKHQAMIEIWCNSLFKVNNGNTRQ